jgi:hypothetical protein
LEQDFPGRVEAATVEATTPESREEIALLGFRDHGLVIRSPAGEVLWKQRDHEVSVDDARQALRDILGAP